MLVTVETIEAAYRFLDRRYHFKGSLNPRGIRNALNDAARLAIHPDDEAAALFYALTLRPKALGGAWRVLPPLIALNHAATHGQMLRIQPHELATLCIPIVTHTMTYADVQAWFASKM